MFVKSLRVCRPARELSLIGVCKLLLGDREKTGKASSLKWTSTSNGPRRGGGPGNVLSRSARHYE